MRQFCVTVSMGKRIIGKALAAHPEVRAVLNKGTLVVLAGTTNGYVAQEILAFIGQAEGFAREGFRRGMTVAPGARAIQADLKEDVVVRDGEVVHGQTIFDVVDSLKAGDVVIKGANAFDPRGQPAVLIGHPQGGTVMALIAAVIGRRVRLIVPVGLEKRVLEDINVLAQRCNAPGAQGPRLFPVPAQAFTEIDALRLLTGAEACLLAAGGVYGAEGASWLGVSGTAEQIEAAADLIRLVADEPPTRV